MDAIVRPPFLLNRMVSEISAAMVQIEKERDTLLNESVSRLHTKVDQLSRDLDQVQDNIDGTEAPFSACHTGFFSR